MHRVVPPTRSTQAQVPTVVLARNPGLEQRHPRRLQILPQNQVGNRGSGTGSQGARPPCHLLAPGDARRAHPSPTEQFQDGKPPPAPRCPSRGRLCPRAHWAPKWQKEQQGQEERTKKLIRFLYMDLGAGGGQWELTMWEQSWSLTWSFSLPGAQSPSSEAPHWGARSGALGGGGKPTAEWTAVTQTPTTTANAS